MKAKFRSYSAVFENSQTTRTEPIISQDVLKIVVNNVLRSHNVVVFGLPEEEGEGLNDKVCEVFQSIRTQIQLDL